MHTRCVSCACRFDKEQQRQETRKRHKTVTDSKAVSQVFHRIVSVGCITGSAASLRPSSLASLSPCMHMCTNWMHLCMLGIFGHLCVSLGNLCVSLLVYVSGPCDPRSTLRQSCGKPSPQQDKQDKQSRLAILERGKPVQACQGEGHGEGEGEGAGPGSS